MIKGGRKKEENTKGKALYKKEKRKSYNNRQKGTGNIQLENTAKKKGIINLKIQRERKQRERQRERTPEREKKPQWEKQINKKSQKERENGRKNTHKREYKKRKKK